MAEKKKAGERTIRQVAALYKNTLGGNIMRFVFETGKLELDSQDLLTGAAFLINLVSEVINSVDVTIDLERANEALVDDDDEILEAPDERILVAVIEPGSPLQIMEHEDAEDVIAEFENDDLTMFNPELGLLVSVSNAHVLKIKDSTYLTGSTRGVVYYVNDRGDIISLEGDDFYEIQKYLTENTVELLTDKEGKTVPAIRLK